MSALPPFRVLSLDGGGMRGAYSAAYLDRLSASFAKRRGVDSLDIGAAFDLIVGTSTGGIIACALAQGIPLGNIVELYSSRGPDIFVRPLPQSVFGVAGDVFKRAAALQSGADALASALKENFGATTLGQVYSERKIALAIPAVELSQHRAWVFKTPHLKDTNHRDDGYTLVDVCLATSAAPIYRSMAVVDHTECSSNGFNVFVDGGLWANNPVLVGLIDALELTEAGQEIQIFCLSTCPVSVGEQIEKKDAHRGLLDWKFGGAVTNVSIDSQQFAYDHMAKKLARHLDRKCTIVRFPSEKVPAALIPYLGLDDTRVEANQALVNQARTDADMTNSRFASEDVEAKLIKEVFESAPSRSNAAPDLNLRAD